MKSLRVSLACCLFTAVFIAPLTAQDKKLTTVNLGYSAISGSFAPLWVGFDQGLFAKHGIDLKMAYIQGNRVMLSALTAGEIHILSRRRRRFDPARFGRRRRDFRRYSV